MKKLLFFLTVIFASLTVDAQVIKDNHLRFEQSFAEIDSISFNPMGCEGAIVLYLKNGPDFWIVDDGEYCRRINHDYNCSNDTISIDLLDKDIYNDIKRGNFDDYIVYYEAFFQLSQTNYWTFEVAKRNTFSKGKYKITRIGRILDCTEGAYDGLNPIRYLIIDFEQIEKGSGPKEVSTVLDVKYNTNIYAVGDIFEMMESSNGVRHFIFRNDAISHIIQNNGK